MKKVFATLGLICVSWVIFSQVTIYEDNFEQYTTGQFPSSNWDAWHNCSSDPTNNIATSFGANSLQVYGAHDGGCWSATATHLISSLPQKLQAEAYLRASGDAGTGSCAHSDIGLALIHQTESSSGYNFIDIGFREDMNIYLNVKGETSKNLQSFSINQWYYVKFEMDATNHTVTAWIDDDVYGPYSWSTSNLPYPLSQYRAIAITSADGKGWGDNLKITDETSTGINKFSILNNISVYPNPAKDKINIKIENRNVDINYIRLFDLLGKKHCDIDINDHEEIIVVNVKNYNPGIYIIKFYTDRGTVTRKIMVQQ